MSGPQYPGRSRDERMAVALERAANELALIRPVLVELVGQLGDRLDQQTAALARLAAQHDIEGQETRP